MKRTALIAATAGGAALAATPAWATMGQPRDGAVDMQPAATQIMQDVHEFHNFILWIIVAISALVLALLLWVIIRYNRRVNPTPHKFTHNIAVEVLWTVVPVLILVVIAWRSFPLLYEQERIPQAELTLKVTGNSWRWDFEYPDLGVQLTSNMLDEETARAEGRPYLLATDAPLYVPIDTTVRVLVTSNDVIHSFAVPAFGFKEDAIMGRVNEGWFNVDPDLAPPGTTVYGQCSELCGVNHAYMPVEIRVVSRPEFDAWVQAQGGTLAAAGAPEANTPDAATQPQPAPAGNPTR